MEQLIARNIKNGTVASMEIQDDNGKYYISADQIRNAKSHLCGGIDILECAGLRFVPGIGSLDLAPLGISVKLPFHQLF